MGGGCHQHFEDVIAERIDVPVNFSAFGEIFGMFFEVAGHSPELALIHLCSFPADKQKQPNIDCLRAQSSAQKIHHKSTDDFLSCQEVDNFLHF